MTASVVPDVRPMPEDARWRPMRAGILGLWQYDEQEFVFRRGRLLLRGRNESGKTKALELLMPFLLDGYLTPSRLDPFGTQSRSMRWNLLGDRDAESGVRIGYVWMEFGRKDDSGAPTFLTIGIGLRARYSSTDVEPWFFVTEQRIGDGLSLVGDGRRAVSRAELVERIGAHGKVPATLDEYRLTVNERLFGMTTEQYGALIDTMLKLRRPHLTEKLDPEGVSEILRDALPPLDEEIVGKLAGGFEQLDRHRVEGQAARDALRALEAFLVVYREYARATCKVRAATVAEAKRARDGQQQHLENSTEAHRAAGAERSRLEAARAEAEREIGGFDGRIDALKASPEFRSAQAIAHAEREAQTAAERERESGERLRRDRDALAGAQDRQRDAQVRLNAAAEALERASADATATAVEAKWDGPARELDGLARLGNAPAARTLLEALVAERERAIRRVEQLHAKCEEARRAFDGAERAVREAEARVHDAEEDLGRAEAARQHAEESFRSDVETWLAGLELIVRSDTETAELLALPWSEAHPRVQAWSHAAVSAIDETAATVGASLLAARTELERARAECARVEAERDPLPPRAHWRAENTPPDGAPLFLCCELKHPSSQNCGAIEGALEASGLLDAWVDPDGSLVEPREGDLLLRARPLTGRTLADVLIPAPAGPVAFQVVEEVLRSVRVLGSGETPDGAEAWVAEDGRFALGPLRGAWVKDEVAYLGAAARAVERERRIACCREQIQKLEDRESRLEAEVATLNRRRDGVREEERRFPATEAVRQAEAAVSSAERALGRERASLSRASTHAEHAEKASRDAAAHRDREANELGISQWVHALGDLRDRTLRFRGAAERLVAEARDALGARSLAAERERETKRREAEVADAEKAHERDRREATRLAERAKTLADALGAGRSEILDKLERAECERRAAVDREKRLQVEAAEARDRYVKAETQVGEASARLEERARALEAAAQSFQPLVVQRLVLLAGMGDEMLGLEVDAVAAALAVDSAITERVSPSARDDLESKIMQRHSDLDRSLQSQTRLMNAIVDGVLSYSATWNGRTLPLHELVPLIQEDIAVRERLLDGEEAALFESFLTGETHEHLGARLRQAHELVQHVRRELTRCPTASGVHLTIDWRLDDDGAPEGAKEAIDLFRKDGYLLSTANKEALRHFLQNRLRQARTSASAGTLRDRMLRELDYRPWFRFDVRYRAPGEDWKRLTRKAHGAGSGGQKAVMLHLPLFAAAAAFYASARPTAPRLVVLDEAFAGIDRPMRAQLMGLLAAFDLDFMMTSFEEWGFYRELDGISTYQLTRLPGLTGVHAEWFLWDGKQSTVVDAQ